MAHWLLYNVTYPAFLSFFTFLTLLAVSFGFAPDPAPLFDFFEASEELDEESSSTALNKRSISSQVSSSSLDSHKQRYCRYSCTKQGAGRLNKECANFMGKWKNRKYRSHMVRTYATNLYKSHKHPTPHNSSLSLWKLWMKPGFLLEQLWVCTLV
jgi:hypothetical protein